MDDRHFGSNRKFVQKKGWWPGMDRSWVTGSQFTKTVVSATHGRLHAIWTYLKWDQQLNYSRNLHTIISYRFVCRICTWESSSMCYIISCKNRYTSEAVTLDVPTAHGCNCSQYKRTVVMFFSPVCPLPQCSLPCHCLFGTWSGGRLLSQKKKTQFPPTH
jgi:hypothetical protein